MDENMNPTEGSEVKCETKEGVIKRVFKREYLILVILALIIAGAMAYNYKLNKGVLPPEKAKSEITNFINENLMQSESKAEIASITSESGMYKLEVKLENQTIEAYMSKDGRLFFPQVMNVAEIEKQKADQKAAEEEAEKKIPKADKPTVDLYVMSFCPYGNKAEDTIKPVYDLLKDKADFNFHYIVNSDSNGKINSLHGQPEVDQNMREACVLKNYGKDAWMNFVTYVNAECGSDGSCWEEGVKSLNVSVDKIRGCVAYQGKELMKAEEKISTDAKASGSPTLLINGSPSNKVYQYGNSESYKQAICNAFNSVPEECSQALTANTSTSEGGSC